MIVKSAIIPAAGLGTRMLPWTKEVPKEMLPVVVRSNSSYEFKPVLQFIFDALFDVGVRYFYFIVGRGKRLIEDYFSPDWHTIATLEKTQHLQATQYLRAFYDKLEACNIVMVNQPSPKGFGDAVLRAEPFMATNAFFIHAGDDILYPNHAHNLTNMLTIWDQQQPDGVLLYEKVANPSAYGVIVGNETRDSTTGTNVIDVTQILEKPPQPPSNNSIVAAYVFTQELFDALHATQPSQGEHQLTDAIQYLIAQQKRVYGVQVQGSRADFGEPHNYLQALKLFAKLL